MKIISMEYGINMDFSENNELNSDKININNNNNDNNININNELDEKNTSQ